MKKLISSERFRFYAWVAGAWLTLWLLSRLINHPDTFFQGAVNEIWKALFVTALNFILLEFTFPFIKLKWERIVAGIFLIWVHGMLYSFGLHGWIQLGSALSIFTAFGKLPDVIQTMSYSTASAFFFGIIRHIYNYVKLKQTAQKLTIEKQEAELNYLKSQTNPHFLFNTLNNIYSLARDKSELAPESILRLSKILRFMLYETSDTTIKIHQELQIISDYISLEKLRYDDTLQIKFTHHIEDPQQEIPPLLLVPFVENAFKHGVSETSTKPFIDIHLQVIKKQLNMIVRNSADFFKGEHVIKDQIGLSNLKRQLQLLYKDYSLTLQRGESDFSAVLNINLASHV